MAPNTTQKRLTIVIPVYNQVNLCRECLQGLAAQTYQDFSVVLLDDCSQQDYEALAQEFPGLNIRHEYNQKNLGAIRNIFRSILYPVQTEYIMSMHEDDLLPPRYIEWAVASLDADPSAAFVGSNAVFFDTAIDITNRISEATSQGVVKSYGASAFVRFLLAGNSFMLASVVYRAKLLQTAKQPDLEQFSIACDRPFLVELLRGQNCLVFSAPIFFSRRHGKKDSRGRDLQYRQVFNLYDYYRKFLPEELNASDAQLFYTSSTNSVLLTYRSLYPDKRVSFPKYLQEARGRGLVQWKFLNRLGVFGLFSVLIGSDLSFGILQIRNRFRTWLQK